MSKKVSLLYGLDIYSTSGEYVGKVEDVLLNLDDGVIMSLYIKPLNGASVDSIELQRIIKEEGVSYDGVTSVGDIILTKSRPLKDLRKNKKKRVMESDEMDSVSMG